MLFAKSRVELGVYQTMNFLFGLPKTLNGFDEIWVMVDGFTKSAHFISIKQTFSLEKLAKFYVDKTVSQYESLVSIISYRDSHSTSKFWSKLQDTLRTNG